MAQLGIVVWAVAECTTVEIPSSDTLLSEDQVIDLMLRPQRWYGRTVTLEIYPYDMGDQETYHVCFEPCDQPRAERSVFVIHTRPERFKGYRGDRVAVVTARYERACVLLPSPSVGGRLVPMCPDLI